MRPRRVYAGIVFAVVWFGMGCQRPVEPSRILTVEHDVTPQPVRVGPVTVSFTVKDASSRPVTGIHVTVEADMSHAGMSPVFAEAAESQPGRYRSQMSLGMAGDWVILLHGTLPSGEKLERQFDLGGVRPN